MGKEIYSTLLQDLKNALCPYKNILTVIYFFIKPFETLP